MFTFIILLVLPAVAIFIPHSSHRASFSLILVKYLQRRLLLRRLTGGTTNMGPDRELDVALEDEVVEVVEVDVLGTQEVEIVEAIPIF